MSEPKFKQLVSELNKLKELCYYNTNESLDDAAALSSIVQETPIKPCENIQKENQTK